MHMCAKRAESVNMKHIIQVFHKIDSQYKNMINFIYNEEKVSGMLIKQPFFRFITKRTKVYRIERV